jgi:large subunit ribosomal protein L22
MTDFGIAKAKYIRISPTKLIPILNKIRGKKYGEALKILKMLPQKSGTIIWKTLFSAISNLVNKKKINKENFLIREAYINLGSKLKRIRPRARGKAFNIEKKFSHLIIKVI